MSIKQLRRECKRIAKQLDYSRIMPDIDERIMSAQTERELDRIMTTCRKRWI